jgi:hypothetical protein
MCIAATHSNTGNTMTYRRFIENNEVRSRLEKLGQLSTISFASAQISNNLLLLGTLESKP